MISVILPTYNDLYLCSQAVNSVLWQNYVEKEIVIVDDSTTNDIEDYIHTLNSKLIRYYHNEKPLGAVQNWNYGLSLARGEYIIVLHHDEEFANRDYLKRVECILSSYDIVVHNKKVLLNGSEKKDGALNHLKPILFRIRCSILGVNYVGPCACVALRRSVLCEFDDELKWTVDIDWYYRLFLKGTVRYINSMEVISHHGGSEQITGSIDVDNAIKEDTIKLKRKYSGLSAHFWISFGNLLHKICH